MLVQRLNFQLKPGNQEKAVELIKETQTMLETPHGVGIYTPNIGPFNTLVYDIEFESLAEHEEFWAKWWALPETPAFMERWNELTDVGGYSEIWTLVE
jgi:hypothetical protein